MAGGEHTMPVFIFAWMLIYSLVRAQNIVTHIYSRTEYIINAQNKILVPQNLSHFLGKFEKKLPKKVWG